MFDAPRPLRLGDGRCMYAKGIGDIQVEMLVKGKWNPGPLTNVWYVTESGQNLFWEFRSKNGDTVAVGIRSSGVYKLLMRVLIPESA
ncbi:hypothetical protein AVEN_137132-1 [Araneus ventricosus]|uniref:Retrovirus-related Pol polyprotein from transposon TNT 1-94-like beta-barrel domain-containing protein n=1 Tax=Araneus ventricosus TaxID=182803 RepID=A0A4Y2LKT1_ARAVE|nr:hypothetical protein AVEN_137132-1 [Araneus ventricosus]